MPIKRHKPTSPGRRFATWANVRCGIGMTVLSRCSPRDGTSRAALQGAQSFVRLVPLLPPTLVVEGAVQPFGLEIVAAQSSIGRWAG